MTATTAERVAPVAATLSRYRWTICALLFFGVAINYVDRQTIALLKPTLAAEFRWSDVDYSHIVFAFTLAYGLAAIVAGRVMDVLGTRRGYGLAVTVWSLAAAAHAVAGSVFGFMAARFVLGAGESGSFPASIKAVAEWFAPRERAFATGIFNAGTSVGTIFTPLLLPVLVYSFGWRWSFVITAAIGFAWLAVWLSRYRAPRAGDGAPATVSIAAARWIDVFPHRQTWAFAIGKFLTDPVWYLYLFWLPDFLHRTHDLNLAAFGLPLAAIYVLADAGSIGGGWLSSTLIARGWSANRARKTTMLVCALCVVPVLFTPRVSSLWLAVLIVGIAAGAHQGFSANLFTLTSDTFETRAVGSVVGIGQLFGATGGMLIALVVGRILQATGSYIIVFLIPCSAYLIALAIIHILSPRLERVTLSGASR
jgi:MFS transporter, ACS family, hexuronate transporter